MSVDEEALTWYTYAETNLGAAKVLLDAGYLNPCLQETQQAAEKALKDALINFPVF